MNILNLFKKSNGTIMVDHLIELVKNDSARFTFDCCFGPDRDLLKDKLTKFAYKVAGPNSGIVNPYVGETWSKNNSVRILRVLKKIYPEKTTMERNQEKWDNTYLNLTIVEHADYINYMTLFKTHQGMHESHPDLKDLWDHYKSLYYLHGGETAHLSEGKKNEKS